MNTRTPAILRSDFDEQYGFNQLVIVYRRHLRARGLSEGTVGQRVLHLQALRDRHPDVLKVTTEDLEMILAGRRHTHAPESRRSMRSSWQSFYGWAVKAGHLEHDPAAELSPIRLPRVVARIADDTVLAQSLERASSVERAMILLGRLAGLRLTEIATLHSANREGNVLRVLGKGEHTRMVPIHEDLIEALEQLERLQGAGYYFRGTAAAHMHPQSVCKIIKRVTGFNPHSLRHAAATAAYEATHDLRGVQQFLGHASLATTERYIHVHAEQIRAIANATAISLRTSRTDA